MLLDHIPKEWPRVFSVVSIGFVGIIAAIELVRDLNNQPSFLIINWAQNTVEPMSGLAAGIILFLSVFAAYALGELITTMAPIYVTQTQKRTRLKMLIAARDDDSGFVRETLRKTDNKVEFFCGLFMIMMISWVAKLIVMAWIGNYGTALFQVPGILLSMALFHFARVMAVRDILMLIQLKEEMGQT